MKIKEWAVAAIIAVGGAMLTKAVDWGSLNTTVSNHETRIGGLEKWKDGALEAWGEVNGKLDALLRANDVEYKPKPKK